MSVNLPVRDVMADVGPVHLRLFPAKVWGDHEDDHEAPWMLGGLLRVTFWFGALRTTKKVTARHHFGMERPGPLDLIVGLAVVVARLTDLITRHAIEFDGALWVRDFEVEFVDPYYLRPPRSDSRPSDG